MSEFLNQIKKCENIDELKKIASIDEISEEIKKEISPLSLNVNSYEELYLVVEKLRLSWNAFQAEGDYFKNENLKYIFALTKMEGQQRNKLINLTDNLYDDEIVARKWRKEIMKKIHPDYNLDFINDAEEAVKEFQIIYDRLEKCFQTEGE